MSDAATSPEVKTIPARKSRPLRRIRQSPMSPPSIKCEAFLRIFQHQSGRIEIDRLTRSTTPRILSPRVMRLQNLTLGFRTGMSAKNLA